MSASLDPDNSSNAVNSISPSNQPQQHLDNNPEGDREEDEDDDIYLDQSPAEAITEFASNPMMSRVQQALFEQLKKTRDRVREEVRDREAQLRKVKISRESTGVHLYTLQQQLATLQLSLETAHVSYNTLAQTKGSNESDIENLKTQHDAEKVRLNTVVKDVSKNQVELDSLNDTIRQVKLYNIEMQSEIAVTRRAAYKAEDNVKQLESNKVVQDVYIDSLTVLIKKIETEINVTSSQLKAQKDQTVEARAMLNETADEMNLITFEKKQLTSQWSSSIIALTKRDEAYNESLKALKEAVTSTTDYDTEIDGLKRSILKSQAKNETFTNVKDRLISEAEYIAESIGSVKKEQDSISLRYDMIKTSLLRTMEEDKKVVLSAAVVESDINNVKHNIEIATRERQKLEEAMYNNTHEQVTVTKAIKNLLKQEKDALVQVHTKEIECAAIDNELARIKVDTLNTASHNVQLTSTLQAAEDELKDKDRLIERYQMEIRQRNDEIEKKMYRVDRLNRKYEKMMDGVEDEESMGPLEASIKNIKKEIEKEEKECERLQNQWLREQNEIVVNAKQINDTTEKNNEHRARANIMAQKRVRLLQEIHTNSEKNKNLKNAVQLLHGDMSRLNDLIGKNGQLHVDLGNENYVIEKEFISELKELEGDALAVEGKIEQVKNSKTTILDEIVECERQIMLWEKKIQLEKETMTTLDPSSSASEAQGMEREISRMRHRLGSLKREQEKMIKEMERAIHKREDIAVKHKQHGDSSSSSSSGSAATKIKRASEEVHTKASLKKKLSHLKKTLKQTARETAQYTAATSERQHQLGQLASELERSTSEYAALEGRAGEVQGSINERLYDKQRLQAKLERKGRMISKFVALEEGAIERVDGEEDLFDVEKKLMVARKNKGKVRGVVGGLIGKFGHLKQVLERVGDLIEDE